MMKTLVALVGLLVIVGCHHTAVAVPENVAPCFSPYPSPPAGTVRIDGPGAFGPHADDSLIVRVDKRERWRGILRTCERVVPGLSVNFGPWLAGGDTLDVIAFDQEPRNQPPRVWLLQLVTRPKR